MKTNEDYEKIIKEQEEDHKLKRNASGALDLTAYEAIKRADADLEQKRREEEYQKRRKLIDLIYKLCDTCGYSIEERIVLKDKETGCIWR
jgi:hypothetical protein